MLELVGLLLIVTAIGVALASLWLPAGLFAAGAGLVASSALISWRGRGNGQPEGEPE